MFLLLFLSGDRGSVFQVMGFKPLVCGSDFSVPEWFFLIVGDFPVRVGSGAGRTRVSVGGGFTEAEIKETPCMWCASPLLCVCTMAPPGNMFCSVCGTSTQGTWLLVGVYMFCIQVCITDRYVYTHTPYTCTYATHTYVHHTHVHPHM